MSDVSEIHFLMSSTTRERSQAQYMFSSLATLFKQPAKASKPSKSSRMPAFGRFGNIEWRNLVTNWSEEESRTGSKSGNIGLDTLFSALSHHKHAG